MRRSLLICAAVTFASTAWTTNTTIDREATPTNATGPWNETLDTAPKGWIITGLDTEPKNENTLVYDNGAAPHVHTPSGNFFASLTSNAMVDGSSDLEAWEEAKAWGELPLGPHHYRSSS